MSRRRSVPWIHRWSRPMIGGIAGLGILNTAYLTYMRLFGGETQCAIGSCKVLASPYATIFGQPLALFGMLAYIAMATMALAPLVLKSAEARSERPGVESDLESKTWLGLFLGATAMLLFSGYLMYIMFSQFVATLGWGGVCPFCLASAIFASMMFILTLVGHDWEEKGQLAFWGTLVGLFTLITTLAIYAPITANAGSPGVAAGEIKAANGTVFFTVKNTASEAEIELAKHLKATGATMYGAYWCPHCYEQKELFGKEAVKEIPYTECGEGGVDAKVQACKDMAPEVEKATGQPFGFPTWKVNGKFYSGRQKLEDLARNSEYKGPQNFKNQF
jgi:uncharacterized membrane protein